MHTLPHNSIKKFELLLQDKDNGRPNLIALYLGIVNPFAKQKSESHENLWELPLVEGITSKRNSHLVKRTVLSAIHL